MQEPPPRLRSGASGYERRPDLYAVRSAADAAPPARPAPVAEITGDAGDLFTVFEGTPPDSLTPSDVVPVDTAGPGGPIAVPTGLVFVRVREGILPEQRRDRFAEAGFEIVRTLPYAKEAAWLKAIHGGIGAALSGIEARGHAPTSIISSPSCCSNAHSSGDRPASPSDHDGLTTVDRLRSVPSRPRAY